MSVEPMAAAQSADRVYSFMDQVKRIKAMPHVDDYRGKTIPCSTVIHVGIFFDGTNNNKKRDQEAIADPDKRCHSNVVVLHDAFRDELDKGYFRFYIPGVGTPFKEIGEISENPDGKAMGLGGDARINWAMLQLLNAMLFSMTKELLITDAVAGRLVNTFPLHIDQATHANLEGKRTYFTGSGHGTATSGGKVAELQRALESQGPHRKLAQVNVSVFGFSRGAAQARAFCHLVHHILLKKSEDGYTLAGAPLRIQFLGLFDSVASVGASDASPFWRGLGGWANGTLDIPPSVQRTVHLCAAHEVRINFPLSSTRLSTGAYPANCVEKVYPGAHSDVGGGYPTGAQGKSVGSRAKLLSQMPLLDMYREAQLGMVPVQTIEQLRTTTQGNEVASDLSVDPDNIKLFNAYRAWSASVDGSVESQLYGHMQHYWRWRIQHEGRVKELPCYTLASPQDRIDMHDSEGDFLADVNKALWRAQDDARMPGEAGVVAMSGLSSAQRDFLRVRTDFLRQKPPQVPQTVDRFFAQMVHDSHASFYLVGPVTDHDKQQRIQQILKKIERERINRETLKQGVPMPRTMTPADDADETWSLSDLERRIYKYQKANDGAFPPISDADREQLLALENLPASLAVRVVNRKTRRELGGHVRYRRVFIKS